MNEALMPRYASSAYDRAPEHSPAMLGLLDSSARYTAHAAIYLRPVAVEAYHLSCAMIAERMLDDAPAHAITYWVSVRNQLEAKFKFTEAEINNG